MSMGIPPRPCPLPQARGQYLQYHDKVVASQQYKQVSCKLRLARTY